MTLRRRMKDKGVKNCQRRPRKKKTQRKTKSQTQGQKRSQSWSRRQNKLPPIPWMTKILASSSSQLQLS